MQMTQDRFISNMWNSKAVRGSTIGQVVMYQSKADGNWLVMGLFRSSDVHDSFEKETRGFLFGKHDSDVDAQAQLDDVIKQLNGNF
jgi:hypothetical protein